jgi:citrate synthase
MKIGKHTVPKSAIATADEDTIVVRGRDLCRELIGNMSFSAYFHLLLTGRAPTPQALAILDATLVAIAEHGLVPSVQASRMTYAAAPDALQGAVAAGILGAGPVIVGTAEECARVLEGAQEQVGAGRSPEAVAADVARSIRASGGKVPGFGHPVHKPLDPRAERILALADERGVSGPHVALARALHASVAETLGKPLPMNVSLPIAAVMLDLGFPASAVKAVPILARTAGLLAHLAEEQQNPIGLLLAGRAEEAVAYESPGGAAR